MKRLFVILVAAACIIGAAAVCLAGPAPKATGAGEFTRIEEGQEVVARFNFEAHGAKDNRPVKGWFKYRDSLGNTFTIEIQCVSVYGDEADFSGPVVKSNMEDWENQWLWIWVEDGGSPADGNDSISGEMYEYDPGCGPNNLPTTVWSVTNGNIVVH
jgi:hypothetical protein